MQLNMVDIEPLQAFGAKVKEQIKAQQRQMKAQQRQIKDLEGRLAEADKRPVYAVDFDALIREMDKLVADEITEEEYDESTNRILAGWGRKL